MWIYREKQIFLLNSEVGDHLIVRATREYLDQLLLESCAGEVDVHWKRDGETIILDHPKLVQQVCWHGRGDYFATVTADGENSVVLDEIKGPHFFFSCRWQRVCRLYPPVVQSTISGVWILCLDFKP